MSVQIMTNRTAQADRTKGRPASWARKAGLPVSAAAIQLVLAYEWLVSGVNKVLDPSFTGQLGSTIAQSMKGNPYGFYMTFLREAVLPHAGLFGVLTEMGELAVGLTLAVSAVLWMARPAARPTRAVAKVACLALAAAILMPLNYFFMSGDPLPWINPGNAFNEAVSIDVLISLLAVPLLVANLRAVRSTSAGSTGWTSRRPGGEPWTA